MDWALSLRSHALRRIHHVAQHHRRTATAYALGTMKAGSTWRAPLATTSMQPNSRSISGKRVPLTIMLALNGNEPFRRAPELYRAPKGQVFQLFPITGDGGCMFRAIVQGLQFATRGRPMAAGSEGGAAQNLRLAVVNELRKRRSEIEPFLPGICANFEEYLQRMSHPQVWGGEPEMVMASHVLQRPISVFRPISSGVEIVVTYGDGYGAKEAINVLWSGAHYDLLLTPKQQQQQHVEEQ